ncbi:Sec-independent protein translocase protein TatB [Pseudooctadecabacter sp.]|uniref:Sec-independent protein translocase protein TatB n=1 Tax=Pseudooctadecabacter sp. TaxID=1966338 RepID=UPI0025D5615E|nr:Sec-independent protein translocase protein TatB [Pseudooctadecabacter sp.]
MFDLGFMEMLVIGVVALIVVGPKDLPGLFRSVGRFMGKAKGMAREFSSAMNAAADEAGVNEINKTIKAAANPQKFGVDKIREATKMDTSGEAAKPATATDKLRAEMTEERKATAEKINKAMAEKAETRMAAEKAQAEAAEAAAKDAT